MPPRISASVRKHCLAGCVVLLLAGVALLLRHHARNLAIARASLPTLPAAFADRVPTRVLWAWEEPEDLRTLPTGVGVAYLAETNLLSDSVSIQPRRQPLRPAPGAPLIAVIRIETRPGFQDTPQLRAALAAHLAGFALRHAGGLRALQFDFDATQSQQPFYRAVLEALRPQLPRGLPLSITALAGWCGPGSWLHTLPIDEAVPMLFRMGGPRQLALRTAARPHYPIPYPITEPLCRSSLGLSTDEPWPHSLAMLDPATRVYLFAPRPWQPAQLAAISLQPLTTLARETAR